MEQWQKHKWTVEIKPNGMYYRFEAEMYNSYGKFLLSMSGLTNHYTAKEAETQWKEIAEEFGIINYEVENNYEQSRPI